jgi:tRNA (guanine-N7-)-methyltransferase
MSDKDPSDVRLRSVRSFVLRAGRATAGQQRALTELWPKYGVEFSPTALDLPTLFGRAAPRMLEIGFGAGEALLEFASAHPEIDCIGVEVHRPGVGRLLLGAEAATLSNLRVICHDAVEVLQHQLPPASIALVHIFFPDPWPKKRHHKRRLIQPAFVELLARVIAPGGTLRLATDWEAYAQHMRAVIDASPAFANIAVDAGFVARSAERVLTRFERRGQRLGHGVWDLEYRRTN